MTEDRVGFLFNLACNLSQDNDTHKILRSYYLMRCKEVTKGYGLPSKYFSSNVRCPHCYLDWTRDADVKVQPSKCNKKQHPRKRSRKKSEIRKNNTEARRCLLQNEVVQVCSFCRRSTTSQLIKPERPYKLTTSKVNNTTTANYQLKQEKKAPKKKEANKKTTSSKVKKNKKNTISKVEKKNMVNLYTNAFDVFSLKNDKNTLTSTIKEPAKVIKNSKKKKDKFAGLCQKAVLASAKVKEHRDIKTQPVNKLNLFLKPSTV